MPCRVAPGLVRHVHGAAVEVSCGFERFTQSLPPLADPKLQVSLVSSTRLIVADPQFQMEHAAVLKKPKQSSEFN